MIATSAADDLTAVVAAAVRLGMPYTFNNEYALHFELSKAFADLGLDAQPEVDLDDRSRIDFVVTADGLRIGIEVKIAGSTFAVARQLLRYSRLDLDGLILVTSVAEHERVLLAPPLSRLPLTVVSLIGQGL